MNEPSVRILKAAEGGYEGLTTSQTGSLPAGTTKPAVAESQLGRTCMKRREMNSFAHSLCAYLCSRNNDIAGYWGIGMLCAVSKREKRPKFSFKIYPGELLRIYSYEIGRGKV